MKNCCLRAFCYQEFTTLVLVPFFVAEVTIFLMCLYKSYVIYFQLKGELRGELRSPLLEVILQNNIFYFTLYVFYVRRRGILSLNLIISMFLTYDAGIIFGALGLVSQNLIITDKR